MPGGTQEPRKPLDGLGVTIMLLICLCWGMQAVAIKLAAPTRVAPGMLPSLQVGLRSAGSACLVGILMICRGGGGWRRDGTFWPGVFAGLLFGTTFLCYSVGLNYTTASHMIVFLYTAPVFTALGLHWLVPGEHLNGYQWIGVLAAFGGLAYAFSKGFSGGPAGPPSDALRGDILGVVAGILWAANTVLIRATSLSEAPPAKTLFYQLVGGAVVLLSAASVSPRIHEVTMTRTVWWSLSFQVVIIGFASFLMWFWLLRRYLASRLSVFSLLSPMFGVSFGVLLLKDHLDTQFITGAVLVLGGILMVNLTRNA